MTGTAEPPLPVELEPGSAVAPELAATALEADARALDDTPCWPVTMLVSWSLTLLLGASVLAPVAAFGHADGIEWLVLLAPTVLATLGSRALFEVLGFATAHRRPVGHLGAAVPSALLAAGLMAGACAIVGVAWTPAMGGATTVLATLTLSGAGAARGFEIRVRLAMRRVYFIGSRASGRELAAELGRHHDATLVGSTILDQPAEALDGAALAAKVLTSRATVVVLDGLAMRVPDLVQTASLLNLRGLRIRDLMSYYEHEFKKIPLAELSPTWFLFDIAPIHRRRLYRSLRRATDIALAALLLMLLSPLLLIAAIVVRLTSPGPAIYRQRRVGKDGQEFTLLKLRTMTARDNAGDTAAWGPSQAQRVTPLGRLLRRFRLDELPQLWNVIRGELAVIGPRPEQVPIAHQLGRELPHYSSRHCIRPGITGWAQVNLGYAGSFEGTVAKLQRDLYYMKHHSLRLDALIVWLTVKAVLAGRGQGDGSERPAPFIRP
jgi:lipopolysaccharide/colanic/teichoic acid biosynthesis glycosyltransferase